MTEPNRLPLRVLVKGASTVIYTSWMGGPRTDFAWPRVIEEQLWAAGYPAEVRCTATPAEPTKFAFRTWQQEALGWSPDVVILVYGHLECIHLFIPRTVERHANSLTSRPLPWRLAYRRFLLRPTWRLLLRTQTVIDRRLPPTLLSYKRARLTAELGELIKRVRTVGSPLVLVPEIPPAGPPYREWFPGVQARMDVMNDTLRELIDTIGEEDVRLFPLLDALAPHLAPGEEACPDGGHFTPSLHRVVGEAMAAVVLEWATQQPHLDLDGYRVPAAGPDRGRLSPTAD